jgi:hypothetical protein
MAGRFLVFLCSPRRGTTYQHRATPRIMADMPWPRLFSGIYNSQTPRPFTNMVTYRAWLILGKGSYHALEHGARCSSQLLPLFLADTRLTQDST